LWHNLCCLGVWVSKFIERVTGLVCSDTQHCLCSLKVRGQNSIAHKGQRSFTVPDSAPFWGACDRMIVLHSFGGLLCQRRGKGCSIVKSSQSRKFFLNVLQTACGPRTTGGCIVDLLNVHAIIAEGQLLAHFFRIYEGLIFETRLTSFHSVYVLHVSLHLGQWHRPYQKSFTLFRLEFICM
jgi:hypothetical protein